VSAPVDVQRVVRLGAEQVAVELRAIGRLVRTPLVVEVLGQEDAAAVLREASGLEVRPHAEAVDPQAFFVPGPHVAVVWLDDGGQGSAARLALFRTALDRVPPGKRLVVLGYVVTAPGGRPNPSVSDVVSELDAVFGGSLHVHELRSLQLEGEPWSRAVVLAATRLGPGTP
jgi:hypothetical protein